MQNISNFIFDLTKPEFIKTFNSINFAQFCSKNGKENISKLIINEKPGDIIQIALKLKKSSEERQKKGQVGQNIIHLSQCPSWAFAEYKLFIWISFYYCYVNAISLNSAKQQDLKIIHDQFPQKPFSFISFQFKCLLKQTNKNWVLQQDELLVKSIGSFYPKSHRISWKHIAYEMYHASGYKILKTYKDCRQRWLNHLDPNVNRQAWSIEEDKQLFILILNQGKRWSKVAKQMNLKRTQHMIKNRYNSYIRKWSRNSSNRSSDFYINDILAYLTKCQQKAKRREINQFQSIQAIIQQKNTMAIQEDYVKLISINQQNSIKQTVYISEIKEIEVKQQQQLYEISFFGNSPKNCPQNKSNFMKESKQMETRQIIAIQDHHFQSLSYSQQNVSDNEQYGKKITETMLQNVQIYFQRDPAYAKVVDDTWLSELQQKQNLKWLQD